MEFSINVHRCEAGGRPLLASIPEQPLDFATSLRWGNPDIVKHVIAQFAKVLACPVLDHCIVQPFNQPGRQMEQSAIFR
jgi:hypothetical protein